MYIVTFVIAVCAALLITPSAVAAQETVHEEHNAPPMTRDGSGTAWLPDESPMYAIHGVRGPWTVMFHQNAFLQFLNESGPRGGKQAGSINWAMGMLHRELGAGTVGLRGMLSLEPWTVRGCGYPDLLATGEECNGAKIHDRQHPHDLFMEVAADYDAPLTRGLRWRVYGGPAAEPALGPVAYPHRVSALPNPLAPIAHHWLDSTHVTFGVVTGGVYGTHWKAESSVFNGREPDEARADFDFAAMNSVSGRFWFLPTPRLALQVSAGHLAEAEAGEGGAPRVDVNRVTASATYHRALTHSGIWATTIAWGRNAEGHHASNALLLETNFTYDLRNTWFARFESGRKSAHDLVVDEPPDDFVVAKLQGGYTRYFAPAGGFQAGMGAGASLSIVPEALEPAYGSRTNRGIALFLTLRPAPMGPAAAAGPGAAPTMVMVQTAFDPAKLTCPMPVDRTSAATTTYEGRVYYFCSAADRDRFLIDPKMSLSMMPPTQ